MEVLRHYLIVIIFKISKLMQADAKMAKNNLCIDFKNKKVPGCIQGPFLQEISVLKSNFKIDKDLT